MPLARGDVDRVLHRRERRLLHVADHADHRVPLAVIRTEEQPLADRIHAGEGVLRERLVDHGGPRRALDVMRIEHAAAPERDAKRLEVLRGDGVAQRRAIVRRQPGRRRRSSVAIALEMDAVHVYRAAQRQQAGERRRRDAGNAPHRLERPLEEGVPGAVGAIPPPRLLHFEREQVRRIETDVDREDALQAPQQQSGADQ